MKANHHPQDDLLLSYADGSLSESWSLAIASHLSVCSECRKTLEITETVGGILLEDIPDLDLKLMEEKYVLSMMMKSLQQFLIQMMLKMYRCNHG